MTRLAILNLALLVLSAQLVALTAAAAVGRGLNRGRVRRREALAQRLRGALVVLTAGEPDEVDDAVDTLAAASPREWRAIEPSVRGLLVKVRGDAHLALVRVLERRGLIEQAMANLTGSWFATRRARAAELLGATGSVSSTEQLISALRDREPQVRVVAARALGHIGDRRAVEPLLDSLALGVPPRVVTTAIAGIDRVSQVALEPSLTHQDPHYRAIAAEVAGLAAATGVVPLLVDMLKDEELEVRIRAARALGRCGRPEARPGLVAVTTPDNPVPLRVVATRALSMLADGAAVPWLAELLSDPVTDVARLAASGLLSCGPEGVVIVVAAAEDPGLRGDVARHALARAELSGQLLPQLVAAKQLGAPSASVPDPRGATEALPVLPAGNLAAQR